MRLRDEAKLADELYDKLVREHCKKTEKGEIEPHEGKPGTFVIPEEKAEEFKKKLEEFHAIAFEIDRPKVELNDVQAAAQLTPMDVMALECFLAFDDEEKPALKSVPKE